MVVMSQPADKVTAAIVGVASKLTNPQFDSTNPFHKNKYVSLSGVREHVHGPLAAAGLVVLQSCRAEGGLLICSTTLLHSSGQWVSGDMPVAPNKSDAQGWAAASTYARRYGLLSLLGIVGDEDDDGNHGLRPPASGILAGNRIPAPPPKPAKAKPEAPAANLDDWGDAAGADSATPIDNHPAKPVSPAAKPTEFGLFTKWLKDKATSLNRDYDDLKAEIKDKVWHDPNKDKSQVTLADIEAAKVYVVKLGAGHVS